MVGCSSKLDHQGQISAWHRAHDTPNATPTLCSKAYVSTCVSFERQEWCLSVNPHCNRRAETVPVHVTAQSCTSILLNNSFTEAAVAACSAEQQTNCQADVSSTQRPPPSHLYRRVWGPVDTAHHVYGCTIQRKAIGRSEVWKGFSRSSSMTVKQISTDQCTSAGQSFIAPVQTMSCYLVVRNEYSWIQEIRYNTFHKLDTSN